MKDAKKGPCIFYDPMIFYMRIRWAYYAFLLASLKSLSLQLNAKMLQLYIICYQLGLGVLYFGFNFPNGLFLQLTHNAAKFQHQDYNQTFQPTVNVTWIRTDKWPQLDTHKLSAGVMTFIFKMATQNFFNDFIKSPQFWTLSNFWKMSQKKLGISLLHCIKFAILLGWTKHLNWKCDIGLKK